VADVIAVRRPRRDGAAETLRDDLFPLAPPGPRLAIAVPAAVAAVALGTWISLARQTGVGALSTVWAEDASIFLEQALRHSAGEALLRAYSGYLHLVPRLAAEVAAALPLRFAPAVFSLTGALSAAVSGVVIWVAAAGHVRSPWIRAALGAAVVLLPASAYETLNSAALAQWHLVAAAWWVALWRPRTRAGTAGAAVWLATTAASSPLALALAPVLFVRTLLLRSPRDRLPVAAWALVCAVQVVVALSQPSPTPNAGSAADLARAYLSRVLVPAMLGVSPAQRARESFGVVAAVAAVLVVVLALAVAAGPRARHRLTALWLVGSGGAAFVAGAYTRGVAGVMAPLADGTVPTGASRLVVVPTLLLLGVVALALDRLTDRLAPAAGRALLLGAAALALAVTAADLRPLTVRSPGPDWTDELDEAVAACRGGADEAELRASPLTSDFAAEVDCAVLAPQAGR